MQSTPIVATNVPTPLVFATNEHIQQKIAKHGPGYLKELEPAIVSRNDKGIVCDRTHPAWVAMVLKYRASKGEMQGPFPRGLGTLTRKGIDLATLGVAKPLANMIAKARGKKQCSACDAREKCLNRVVPDVSKVGAMDWVLLTPKILACIGAKVATV